MTIDLADFEKGKEYKGHYRRDLEAVQGRLEKILVAHIIHARPAVIMLEGWDAAGKGGIIQRLVSEWDPRRFEVYPISAPSAEEKAHPFLWRFRERLPEPGNIAIFDRSWYGRVLVERVEGYAMPGEWRRAYGQITAFEAKLIEGGTTLIKLFVHVSQSQQDKRLKDRLKDPWKRWKTGADDYRNRAKRAEYLEAMHEMFARTDTAVAPWTVIDGNDKKSARIAALTHIADTLAAQVPMEPPPIDPEVARLAKEAFG
ncbi:polyphosphate kinase [Sphingomonas sp. SUN019]|uniref:polyphosphate kinase 2 family protein n=1 Tax=Sphingomonas sp. SUN019 TaxID=2937788 RepID=UPI00216499A4|nr:polyphosphate kinase [Sphingomonas sp. SUN019]UVO49222.1 polyphosphate kinase [Sphingomonas sp. SUN019]